MILLARQLAAQSLDLKHNRAQDGICEKQQQDRCNHLKRSNVSTTGREFGFERAPSEPRLSNVDGKAP